MSQPGVLPERGAIPSARRPRGVANRWYIEDRLRRKRAARVVGAMTDTSRASTRAQPRRATTQETRDRRLRAHRQVRALPFVAAAGVLFAALLVLVRTKWAPLTSLDHGVAADLNSAVAPHPLLVGVLKRVTTLGSNGVLWWVVGLATIVLVTRRQFRLAWYLASAGIGALILDPTLKALVGRLRPVVADPIAHGGGNSFPSGHALGSFVCYGALLLVFLPALHGRWRTVAVTVAAVVVAAVGITRIMLGVHYLSDVIGGWLLASRG